MKKRRGQTDALTGSRCKRQAGDVYNLQPHFNKTGCCRATTNMRPGNVPNIKPKLPEMTSSLSSPQMKVEMDNVAVAAFIAEKIFGEEVN
jgi:hypothetical protein